MNYESQLLLPRFQHVDDFLHEEEVIFAELPEFADDEIHVVFIGDFFGRRLSALSADKILDGSVQRVRDFHGKFRLRLASVCGKIMVERMLAYAGHFRKRWLP